MTLQCPCKKTHVHGATVTNTDLYPNRIYGMIQTHSLLNKASQKQMHATDHRATKHQP